MTSRLCRKTDAIITYVDCSDPVWQADMSRYGKIENEQVNLARFRSYDMIKTLIRCIRRFMPFIDVIHIVVSSRSQVQGIDFPDDDIRIICHEQIIPNELLPLFNSQAIEQFLHKVPGLKEHYIYFNDDMFPIKPLEISDFYRDGKPVWKLKHYTMSNINNGFRHVCMNSYMLAYAMFHRQNNFNDILVPYHSVSPMYKSDSEEIFKRYEKEILSSLTKFRRPYNLNQYLYSVYSILKRGHIEQQDNFFKYVPLNHIIAKPNDWLCQAKYKIVCLNDTDDVTDFDACRKDIKTKFDELLA